MSTSRIEQKSDLRYDDRSSVPFEIEFTDPKHHGLSAKFRIRHIVRVKDRDPQNVDSIAFEKQFMITGNKCRVDVPSSNFPSFGYVGYKIEIACQAEVVVDDAVFFDTKQRLNIPLIQPKPKYDGLASTPGDELDPHDELNFLRNFAALSLKQKFAWLAAFFAFILTAVGNFLLALFDMFVATVPIFYSGESDGATIAAGIGAVAGGIGFAAVHKRILRSYKTVRLVENPPMISKGMGYRLSDFFAAKSTVNLKDVTVRLVVANLECGQYWRDAGTDRRCVTFTHPSRALVLFEKTVSAIPKGVGIETYFNDRLNLDDTFEYMRPNNMISRTHGVKLKTVIQIMVSELADTSLELPTHIWRHDDFALVHDPGGTNELSF